MTTTHFSGPVDSAAGFSVNGTTVIDASGNVDAPITSTTVTAGSSGTAGTVDIFPATASKGKLEFKAANSAGNTTTLVTNASQAAARTYTIPDAGASASFVMTAGTQTLAGATTFSAAATFSNSIVMGAGSFINADKGTATEASNAVTLSKMAGVITTSALTTAGAANYAITWTNTEISSSSVILMEWVGGTNTVADFNVKVVPGSGSATITIYNNTAATALNGTIALSFLVI